MAGWQTILVSNDTFRVTLTTSGARRKWLRWRWLLGKHVPYFVGKQLHFAARIETLKPPQENRVMWSLHHSDSHVTNGPLAHPQFGNGPATVIFQLPQLAESGEYVLRVGPRNTFAEPLAYSFSVVTLEGFLVKFIAPMLFGIGSLILGYLNWIKHS
ncbi:MAG: hypothetical protein IIC31_11295 [Chloroflexi bacterium]|nr:hypothetical protein [Chloroflexota bacterium]